jgi:hypothetical protein
MLWQRHLDLLERKKRLKWTRREIGNILNCSPSVAASKLNGFIVFTSEERTKIINAMETEEKKRDTLNRGT